eukprot:SAG31_NODE_27043_length_432_cov_0.774775_1_plen_76_part_01
MSPALATGPVPNSSWSFAADRDLVSGTMSLYAGLSGKVTHARTVLFSKESAKKLPPYIVVVDCVTTDRNRTVQAT